MICSASSGTTSQTSRRTTSVDSLSSASSSGLQGWSPDASARRAAIFASVCATSAERLVGTPDTIGGRPTPPWLPPLAVPADAIDPDDDAIDGDELTGGGDATRPAARGGFIPGSSGLGVSTPPGLPPPGDFF